MPAQCEQEDCRRTASHRIFWPGREPLRLCPLCCLRAVTVATGMGFHLVHEVLPDDVVPQVAAAFVTAYMEARGIHADR